MRTQTKCTLTLSGLLIIELFPMPVTSIYCLFVIRKRPAWLPQLVERLYSNTEKTLDLNLSLTDGYDALVTRRRCTLSLSLMLILDFLIPFTILFGLYIVRKRPIWFKNLIGRLYADQNVDNELIDGSASSEDTLDVDALDDKYDELQKRNIKFALSSGGKTG